MKIFVARLNYDTTDEGLQSYFEQYGTVNSAKVVMDRETGRSRGFGFVEMEDDSEAREAIEGLDSTDLDGRTIVVKEAEDRGDSRGGRGGNRGGGRRRSNDGWNRH